MIDYVIIAVIVIIVCAVSFYLYREKKSGSACIGCPHSKQCKSAHCCSCSSAKKNSDEK